MNYYIASCVFTERFPALSVRIQNFMSERYNLKVVRCCTPNYKVTEFEERIPDAQSAEIWKQLPQHAELKPGDNVYSLCHNCNNIIEEIQPGVNVHSIWELIAEDDDFKFPDLHGAEVTIQDCWRARDRKEEQDAVRRILQKMNARCVEAENNYSHADFCGTSLLRPQPPRNPKLAPKHYAQDIDGLFEEHSPDEQKRIMEKYCGIYTTDMVICYCHYCLEGLLLGGKDGKHLAQLLF